MQIKILGAGCANCERLEKVTNEAVARLGLDATVEHVRDFEQIMAYGVMSTPALVVDGEVRAAGRVPKVEEIEKLLASSGPGV